MPTQHELLQQIAALSEKVALLGQALTQHQEQMKALTATVYANDKAIDRIQTKLAMVAGFSSIVGGLLVTFAKSLFHA